MCPLKCSYGFVTPSYRQRTHFEKNSIFKRDALSFIQMAQSVRKKFILSLYLYYLYLRHLKISRDKLTAIETGRKIWSSYYSIAAVKRHDLIQERLKATIRSHKKRFRAFLKLRKTVKYTSSSLETMTGKASCPRSPQFVFRATTWLCSQESHSSVCRIEHWAWKPNSATHALILPLSRYLFCLYPSFLSYKIKLTLSWLEKYHCIVS